MRTRRASFLVCTVGASVGVDRLRARLAAELGDGHPVEHRVDPAIAAGVVAVADRLAGALGGRGGNGAVPLKRANPPLVKRRTSPTSTSSSATDRVSSPQSCPCGAALAQERLELRDDLLLLAVERSDLRVVSVEQLEAAAVSGAS